ncbi:MAG: hypothetical protein [Circular genetic element sp.]|nr:MAG: hypothetical protein [Circular genetic element sp.]
MTVHSVLFYRIPMCGYLWRWLTALPVNALNVLKQKLFTRPLRHNWHTYCNYFCGSNVGAQLPPISRSITFSQILQNQLKW